MKKRWPFLLLAILAGLQFLPERELPKPVDDSLDFFAHVEAPAQIVSLTKAACYDCHSHQQSFPWYDQLQPVSWWIRGHVIAGQSKLNFSTWGAQDPRERNHKLAEAAEETTDAHMPLRSYTWLHSEAKLSEEDRAILSDFFSDLADR